MPPDRLSESGKDARPFLRSPAFPWVAADIAAVTGGGGTATRSDAEAALPMISALRIGGDFWSPASDCWAATDQGADIYVQAPTEPEALIGGLRGVTVRDASGRAIAKATLREAIIEALVAPTYRNPFTGGAATLAETVALLGEWRRILDVNRRIAATTGMAWWKRDMLSCFLWNGSDAPPALPAAKALSRAARARGAIGYWPSRVADDFVPRAAATDIDVVAVEDGFIRSVGLGADCRVPFSITLDAQGIHYDPAAPSDLETILATHEFPSDLLDRAGALRETICRHGITKYGVEQAGTVDLPSDRRVVLAIGQVEDDLSVRHAGASIAGNADFLARVRADEPDAYILYRPHPDVVAGHRRGHVSATRAAELVDEVRADGALLPLLARVDAIHVLSSLTGFEALLRGVDVVVHGQPFYAGWGLTRDLAPALSRRGRALPLDALVAAALILYPRYIDPVTRLPCPPEVFVARMIQGVALAETWLTRLRHMQGMGRRQLQKLREAVR